MTKDEILQKVNDYCNEKSYTNSTLTDGFKDKFAEHFLKANEEADINDEQVLANMKFAINTAFSSASSVITEKTKAFESKEIEYRNQIEELSKKVGGNSETKQPLGMQIPKEIEEQLKELKSFKDAQSRNDKFKEIVELAKKGIRQDLHGSFDKFAKDYQVKLDVDDQAQADSLVVKFQDIFKDSIGDIKPLAPKQVQKRDEELLANIKKVKVC